MWSELLHIWESHLYANGTVGFQFGVWPTLFIAYAIFRSQPDLGWMRRMQQILGRKHQRNLHVCSTLLRDFAANVCIYVVVSTLTFTAFLQAIYVLHPTFHLKATIFALQLFVDNAVCLNSSCLYVSYLSFVKALII